MDIHPDSPPSDHSSPLSSHEYDPDQIDSSSNSSSGGDHPSPSSDNFPSAIPTWAYDLGLSPVPSLISMSRSNGGSSSNNNGGGGGEWNEPSFGLKEMTSSTGLGGEFSGIVGEDGLSLTGDFWSTAPNTTTHSPFESNGRGNYGYSQAGNKLQTEGDEMQVEFDDVVREDVCGPSSVTSPHGDDTSPPPPSHHRTLSSAYTPSLTIPHESVFQSAMSMPVDLVAVNAGISPQLTGGRPTPPLHPDSLQHQPGNVKGEVEDDIDEDDVSGVKAEEDRSEASYFEPHSKLSRSGSTSTKHAHSNSVASTSLSREPSETRKRESISTNLVAKDAIVAAGVISSLSTHPLVGSFQAVQLLVLGVPSIGAKSRVETQIKISLVLVAPKPGRKAIDREECMTGDGGLREDCGDNLQRVGSWSHVRLPKYLALKKKIKKPGQVDTDPQPKDTLFLDVAVRRGSESCEEIFICTGCRQREEKRALRKKEARVRPAKEPEMVPTVDEGEEMRKVVVFNCPEFVEFGAGETVLPTRITCYCRHHKEKLGFSISFTLRTSTGQIVASGLTPPIMITDDHKTSHVKPVTTSAEVSEAKATTGKKGKANKKAEVASARPKRAASSRMMANRGVTESDEEILPEPSPRLAAGKKHIGAKPYDTDSRPRKRQSGVHRSPAFAMTSLTMSKPSSPVIRPLVESNSGLPSPPLTNLNGLSQAQTAHWESALGLGGMDAVMVEAPVASSSFSNSGLSAPSPAQSYDWRSASSSPSTTAESYIPFYNTLTSPDLTSVAPSLGTPSVSSPQDLSHFTQFYQPPMPASVVSSAFSWAFPAPQPPPPRISRLIPGEGPVHGGIEVTVLGENFVRDLVCVFGDSAAVPTHFWSSNTLVCILPPSANPGPVVVGIKGVPLTVEAGTGLQLFTYKDDSDRSLLELALQVVGLKMTGRLEDASAVAMRIVGNSGAATPNGARHVSPTDTAGLAMRMNAAADSVYSTPNNSRPPSRQASMVNLSAMASSQTINGQHRSPHVPGQTRNFEGIVIKFLSLTDLDPSLIPGSAPSLPLISSPLSHLNAQRHSLLHLATVLGFHRLAHFLISRGIDLEAKDRNGYTALHFAALYGRVAITRQLLDAGAAGYIRNLAGQTPLDIARERDDVDVQDLLLRIRPAPSPRRNLLETLRSVSSTPLSTPPLVSRSSTGNATPTAEYAQSEASRSDSDTSSDEWDEDDDDASFHSSDEEVHESDVERGLSRKSSVVSLHHLVDSAVEEKAERERREASAATLEDVKAPFGAHVSLPRAKATGTTTWLGSKLPFSTTTDVKPSLVKLPLSPSGVWEKMPRLPYANGAWEKMRLPNGFALPLQMPELTAFQGMASIPTFSPKSWISGSKSEGGNSDGESEEPSDPASRLTKDDAKAWKTLYGPWWQKAPTRASSPPPPMYSPMDTLQKPSSPVPSTSALPPPPPPTLSREQIQAKLQRRVGYAPDEISDSLAQTYVHHEKKMQGLKQDKMLFLFWIPILILVLGFAIFSTFGPYIRPFLFTVLDTLLPSTRSIIQS